MALPGPSRRIRVEPIERPATAPAPEPAKPVKEPVKA